MQAIEFRNVRKEYQDGSQIIQALKPTNLVINKGEFVAIVGPSGSGKSTFLTLAGGLLTPSEGEILVNNQPFSQVAEKKRAQLRFKEIGFILQSSNLIPFLTIEDQMRLVDKITHQPRPQLVQELFEQLSIQHLAKKYPEKPVWISIVTCFCRRHQRQRVFCYKRTGTGASSAMESGVTTQSKVYSSTPASCALRSASANAAWVSSLGEKARTPFI